jgi:hypothetical protein
VIRGRIVCAVIMLVGTMVAAVSLLSSQRDFGIAVAVVALAWVVDGLLRYLHDHEILETRRQVWRRRDAG